MPWAQPPSAAGSRPGPSCGACCTGRIEHQSRRGGSARAGWAPGQPQAGHLSPRAELHLPVPCSSQEPYLGLADPGCAGSGTPEPGAAWEVELLLVPNPAWGTGWDVLSPGHWPSLVGREMWLADPGCLCSDPSSHGQLGQSLEDFESLRPCSSLGLLAPLQAPAQSPGVFASLGSSSQRR